MLNKAIALYVEKSDKNAIVQYVEKHDEKAIVQYVEKHDEKARLIVCRKKPWYCMSKQG